ncbi:hypothetical protein AB9K34_09195 [Sedimentitalea sp. XS_ASV28]|uniref:hypothetical protein n=1 Tax=Sedimentitalea sp. XS_ASV28 TaxID=3241296 RepID=UPI0035158DF6
MGQKLRVCLAGYGILLGTMAQADCPAGQEAFTSCQIEGRNTEVFVCFDDHVATYSYGPTGGTPELFLSENIEHVDFKPWSGLGKAISESVTFYNGDYAYDVGGGFDRPFSDEEMAQPIRRFGWVEVTQRGERVVSLECIPDTVSYGFGGGIYDAKVAAGLTWSWDSKTWISELIQPTATPSLMQSQPYNPAEDCLPASEFSLNGVAMGDPLDKLGKLGSPEPVEDPTSSGEKIDRMTLVGMALDIFEDVVIAMSSTSPDWKMPSGLRVGLTRGEVIRILGRVPNGYAATSQTFVSHACMENQDTAEWSILIEFGQDRRVSGISFARPWY